MTESRKRKNREATKRYRLRHPERIRAQKRAWYRRKKKQSPRYFARILRQRRKKNPGVYRQYARSAHDKIRLKVLSKYCGGKPKCMCPGCDVSKLEFLTLQHIHGGGTKQRHALRRHGTGINFYYWVRKYGYPKYLTVFCANCNLAESRFGGCPHRRVK